MILYGVAGWSYADWNGTVYPRRRPQGFHPLTFLARYLDLMELNSSFYALPQAQHAERWVQLVEAAPDFRFSAKLHRAFTHEGSDGVTQAAARSFLEGLAPLVEADRLVALLAQFPVAFREGRAGWERLERLRELFRDSTLVLELRHKSWFEGDALVRLAGLGYGLAHIDLPAARDHPPVEHGTLHAPAYLRLHGRNRGAWFDVRAGRDERYDYRYAAPEIQDLARRLEALAARNEKALLVANNHFGGKALAAALQIKARVEGAAPLAPMTIVETFPDLGDVLRVDGQQRLF